MGSLTDYFLSSNRLDLQILLEIYIQIPNFFFLKFTPLLEILTIN